MTYYSIGDMVRYRYDGSKDRRIGIIVGIKENNNDYQDDEYILLWLNDGHHIPLGGYISEQLVKVNE